MQDLPVLLRSGVHPDRTEAGDAESADIRRLEVVKHSRHGLLRRQRREGLLLQDLSVLVSDGADHLRPAGFQRTVSHGNLLFVPHSLSILYNKLRRSCIAISALRSSRAGLFETGPGQTAPGLQ